MDFLFEMKRGLGPGEEMVNLIIILKMYLGIVKGKELCPAPPNSDIRKLCTVHCGKNVNKPSAPTVPTEVEGKGQKL